MLGTPSAYPNGGPYTPLDPCYLRPLKESVACEDFRDMKKKNPRRRQTKSNREAQAIILTEAVALSLKQLPLNYLKKTKDRLIALGHLVSQEIERRQKHA